MIFFDGFLDTYYAYDFNEPPQNERVYTTQPARHDGPNINLVSAGINLKQESFRGRFALQAGNAVDLNYAAERNPDHGHIQEAFLGYRLGSDTWIDGGIFFSHLGMENWISAKNITYSRSLAADYSPYYSTGLRLVSEIEDIHFEFHLVQGWQIINETNSAKAFGFQLKKEKENSSFAYNSFFGDENVIEGSKTRFRTFHNFIFEKRLSDALRFQTSFDVGTEAQQDNDGVNLWTVTTFTLQQKLNEKNFLGYRVEYYADPHQVNIPTDTPHGFEVFSASVNVDHFFTKNLLWRNEIRGFYSKDEIFPETEEDLKRTNGFFVTSLSYTF